MAGESFAVPRVLDVYAGLPSITGKLELEYEGELKGGDAVARELIRLAVGKVFTNYFEGENLNNVVQWFELGGTLKLDEGVTSSQMVQQLTGIQGLMEKTKKLGLGASEPDAVRAGAGEFILEGLYAHKRISRNEEAGFTAGERAVRERLPDEGKQKPKEAISVKSIRYGRYTGEDFGLSTEDLLKALADFFLNSGFDNPYMRFSEFNQHTLEDLKRALEDAILNGEMFDPERAEQIRQQLESMSGEEIDQLLNRLVQKLVDEGYINTEPQEGGGGGEGDGKVEVQITDKSVDFLGYKTLKDLLGSLGRSSFGAHDTRDMATGVEASGASKIYEFGDSMNLDVNTTLFSALSREGLKLPINLEYRDLHVHQSEYQSSCATVLMLDCSHSMILYGEDRFTPAKKVAMALAHLIRTQYPGDSLRCVLFHDSAEELRIEDLARVQVGPYYTNTREGLILAQRLLAQEKKDMKQIIMITDGKPSALTLEDGRIYKNAFGLDPLVISRTLEEVSRCKRQGILINTFMLASDYGLVNFIQKVTELCRGKAYFTTPYTLGQYLLMDYMNRKTRTIH